MHSGSSSEAPSQTIAGKVADGHRTSQWRVRSGQGDHIALPHFTVKERKVRCDKLRAQGQMYGVMT